MQIAVKPEYSAMAGTHSAIEGAIKLRQIPDFHLDKVKTIRIGVVEAMMHHGGFKLDRPATPIGAQMNHCYVVAVTLLDGSPSVQQFSPDRINRDDVWNLLQHIDVYRDPEIEARGEEGRWGTRLTVTFTNGRTEEVEVQYPKGGSQFPLSNDDIIRKYDRLTSLVLDGKVAENLKKAILDVENCPDVSEIFHLLSGEVRSPF
jgi:2-methylcitrate dehydratase PrpD